MPFFTSTFFGYTLNIKDKIRSALQSRERERERKKRNYFTHSDEMYFRLAYSHALSHRIDTSQRMIAQMYFV